MNKYFIYILIFFTPLFSQEVIGEGLNGEDLINYLQNNYTTNSVLSYNNARDILYSEIDKQSNGNVYCIYTNYSTYLPTNVDPSTHLYENGMDCEHVWPQSMYEGSSPMKSDMHHLRPCKSNVNSSRGNKPFNNINDYNTDTWFWLTYQTNNIPSSNIDEYSESQSSYFEPREDVKGDIARAMFYFYTIYEDVADNSFFEQQKEILFNWHNEDETTTEEIVRTNLIATYQENIPNPFIIDSTLINRCYFNIYNYGDINEDGFINITDILYLVNYIIGSIDLNNQQLELADINQDNIINVVDIIELIAIIIGE